MNTAQTWQTESTSLEATLELAGRVGRELKGGETIVLTGDLGAGKTAFTRGLARGIGSSELVRSPSFTLSNQYQSPSLTLHHFDFYRLSEPGIMSSELHELLANPRVVVVVEWADIIEQILPAERLTIQIKATGDTRRQFIFSYSGAYTYLIPKNN